MKTIKYAAPLLAVLMLIVLHGCGRSYQTVKGETAPPKLPIRLETTGSVTLDIEFDAGKSDIKAKYSYEIKRVADYMKAHPNAKVSIQGHTDNGGDAGSNLKLSLARADSVRAYLVNKYGIEPNRVRAVGYGQTRPIASNATEEGRQKNRRVEAVVEK
jgi:OOP family OmpA-OmpF porin